MTPASPAGAEAERNGMRDFLDIAPEAATALAGGGPVVALESTAIAHGLPWPDNLAVAREMTAAVRAAGAVPAVIAVAGGRIRIGLLEAELEALARGGAAWEKLSRRDLAAAVATGRNGATTVASTMICAAAAGIRLFATGGIGGVHRGAETSFDVSADLPELGRTPVAVVCAGAKSILDLPKTLEVLETLGVPVVGYGTNRFPGFHMRDSGLALETRVDGPRAAAALIETHRALGLDGGLLIANPVPAEAALDAAEVEGWIADAVAEAAARGMHGKALTPFLLTRLAAISGGRTLAANRALLVDNARVAGEIAAALAERGHRA